MKFINKSSVAALFLSSAMVLTSCEAIQNANNTQKGAVIGTAAGAVLGAVIGLTLNNESGEGKCLRSPCRSHCKAQQLERAMGK